MKPVHLHRFHICTFSAIVHLKFPLFLPGHWSSLLPQVPIRDSEVGPVPQFNPNGQSLVRTWVCNPTQQVKLQAVDPVHEPHVFHSPSTEIYMDDSSINPFKLNGIYHSNFCSYWTMSFPFKGLLQGIFF